MSLSRSRGHLIRPDPNNPIRPFLDRAPLSTVHANQPQQQFCPTSLSGHLPRSGPSNPIPLSPEHANQQLRQMNRTVSQSMGASSPPGQSNSTPLFPEYPRASPSAPVPRHTVSNLSFCLLNYFFAAGLSYTSAWAQRPNLSTSIYIQCFLNQTAFSLFLLSHAVFAEMRPELAFILEYLSFVIIVISTYLASMPMLPPYFAIIMFLLVAIVYIFARFRG